MSWIKWSGLILASAACVAALLWAYGATSWATRTRKLTERLEAARVPPPVVADDARELDGLPAPVRRYFRAVLRDGQSIVSAVSVSHSGRFNLSAVAERWKPFTSTQRVVTRRPGFVWDGRVAMLPGLTVHVHDAYIAGVGILHPALLGLFTLADLHGTGDIAEGELMRFVAEAAWYPTALLPSQGVRWEPLDARSARVTLDDEGLRLTLTFSFGDDGLRWAPHASTSAASGCRFSTWRCDDPSDAATSAWKPLLRISSRIAWFSRSTSPTILCVPRPWR